MKSPASPDTLRYSKIRHHKSRPRRTHNPVWQTLLVAIFVLLALPVHSLAQDTAKRKIVDHATPVYPEIARSMALAGSVKVEAVVEPDGTVKAIDIRGGHPVLAQAAVNAIRRWRWESAPHESREVVEIKFNP